MDRTEVERILHEMHCRACDLYGCDHRERVADALAALKALAAQQVAEADRAGRQEELIAALLKYATKLDTPEGRVTFRAVARALAALGIAA